uniref:Uncharacterized protein n=1 Tax=Gossypium raimondii TaxID=29730 RepID=A0A0D2QS84_GOSRA|nr:hypothetical protein B456_009G331000 [Gossypium raimondii]
MVFTVLYYPNIVRFNSIKVIKKYSLVVSKSKISLFQTRVGHYVAQGTITPIEISIEFVNEYPNQILDKDQLQRLRKLSKPLYERLKKNPQPWTKVHTNIVIQIKKQITKILCLHLADLAVPKIVEIDAFEMGDLLNKKFLLQIDIKSAKEVLQNDVQNIASKHIFAR